MFETKRRLREKIESLEDQLRFQMKMREMYRNKADALLKDVQELQTKNTLLQRTLNRKYCECAFCGGRKDAEHRKFRPNMDGWVKEGHSSRNTTHVDILCHFDDYEYRDYFFMIAGKNGPTGKTWLWDALTRRGFKAVELCDSLAKHGLMHRDVNDRNGYTVDHVNKTVLIVLNKPLDMDLYRR